MASIQEQRRFFRVNTDLPVGFEILGEAEAELQLEKVHEGLIHPESGSLNERIELLLAAVQSNDPVVGELLALINNKLDKLMDVYEVQSVSQHPVECELQHVSISACGLAFVEHYYIDHGKFVLLHMQLPEKEMHLMAKVVDCQQVLSGDYRLRLEFVDLPALEEDFLIQFIMQCDAQNRRNQIHIQ